MCPKTRPTDPASAPLRGQTLTPGAIRDALVRLVASRFDLPVEAVTDDARLRDDLGLDSLFSIEFMMAVEEEFEMDIDDDASRIKTVGDAIRYIESKAASRG